MRTVVAAAEPPESSHGPVTVTFDGPVTTTLAWQQVTLGRIQAPTWGAAAGSTTIVIVQGAS